MIQYPQVYRVQSSASSGIQETWSSEGLVCAIPQEFEGPGGGFSPEDFYALALTNCFVATFKVFAEKSRLSFGRIETKGSLTVDRDEKGHPWMAKFHLEVFVKQVLDPERVQILLEKTSKSCLILNSVKTEKTFSFQIDLA